MRVPVSRTWLFLRIAAPLLGVALTLTPSPGLPQPTAPQKATFTVISDAPGASPFFVEFFYHFNGAMIRWWNKEGRMLVKARWRVSASEFSAESGAREGIFLTIVQDGSPRMKHIRIRATRNPKASAERVAASAIGEIERRSGKEMAKAVTEK